MKKTILVLLALLLALTMTVLLVACNDNPGPVDPTDQDPCKNGHVEDDGAITVQPTCQTEGTRTYRCKVCGEVVRTEPVNKTDHVWDNGTQTQEPGCGTVGKMTFRCTVEGCNETKTEDIPATGVHTKGTWVPEEPATCKKEGTHDYYQCTNCSAKLDDDGNEYDADDLVIPKAAHTWDSGVVTPATCEEEGHITYTCEVCSTTSTQTIPANGHTYGELIPQQDATCEHTGVEAHYMCSVCGKLFDQAKEQVEKTDLEIGLAKHALDEVTGKPATCTEDGFETYYKCNVCNKLFADDKAETPIEQPKTLTATGHKPIPYGDKAATCTEAGYANGKICSECGTVIVQPKRVAPLGHDYKLQGWKWGSSNLTATATFECTHENCPEPTVQVTGDATVESTLDTDTFTVKVKGPDGRDYTQTTTYDHNHPHVYEFVEWRWTGDDESGYTATAVFDCSKCRKVPQEVKAELTSEQVDSTCTQAGHITYTANAEYEGVKAPAFTKTVELELAEHKLGTELEYDEENPEKGHGYRCENCHQIVEYSNHSFTQKHDDHEHWNQCECGYTEGREAHSFIYTHKGTASSKQHTVTCENCEYSKDEACTLDEDNYCDKCKTTYDDGKEDVTIHFHLPDGWSKAYLWAWSTPGGDIFSSVSDSKREMTTDPQNSGWVMITVRYPIGVERGIQFASALDWTHDSTSTTHIDGSVTEVWCANNGKAYKTYEEAIAGEGIKGPTETDWFVTGTHNGWGATTDVWDYAFGKMNGEDHYTVEIEFHKGDTFKIKPNYEDKVSYKDWDAAICYNSEGKWSVVCGSGVKGIAKNIFSTDTDNNFVVQADCTLSFTFDPSSSSKTVAITIVSGTIPSETIPDGCDPIRVHFGNNVVTIYLVDNTGKAVGSARFGDFSLYTFQGGNPVGFGEWEVSKTNGKLKADLYATSCNYVPEGWIFRWNSNKSQTADIKNMFEAGKSYLVKLPSATGKPATVVEVEEPSHDKEYWFTGMFSGVANWSEESAGAKQLVWDATARAYVVNGVELKANDVFLIKKAGEWVQIGYESLTVKALNGKDVSSLFFAQGERASDTSSAYNISVLIDCTLNIAVDEDFTEITVTIVNHAHVYGEPVWGSWQCDEESGSITVTFTCKACGETQSPAVTPVKTEQAATDCQHGGTVTYTATVTFDCNDGKGSQEFTAPTEGNVVQTDPLDHQAAAEWKTDVATHKHYHECIYAEAGCTERLDEDDCDYATQAPHQNDDGTTHYRECTVCSNKYNETCTAVDNTYHSDRNSHWKLCACGRELGKTEHDALVYTAHSYEEKHVVKCDTCKFEATEACTPDSVWYKNADQHWHECTLCHSPCQSSEHKFVDQGGKQVCSDCGEAQSDVTIQADGVDDHRVGSIAEAIKYIHENHNTVYAGKTEVTIVLNSDRQSTGFTLSDDSEVAGFHLVIDLNDHSFTVTETSINVVAGANVTFKNGIFQGGARLGDTPMIVTEGTVTFENVNLTRSQKDYVAVQIDGGKFTVTVNEKDEHGAINGTLLYNNTSAEVVINGTKIGYTGKLAEGITCEQANIMVNGEKLKHSYSSKQVKWDWTSDETGGFTSATATFTCTLCGQGETRVTANEGGGLLKETDQATCTKDGKETYTATVTVPNTESDQATATNERTLTATGHSYQAEVTWTEGTIDSKAQPTLTVVITCINCQEVNVTEADPEVTVTVTRVAKALGDKEPLCEATGLYTFSASVEYKENTFKPDPETKQYTVNALGHDFDGGTEYHNNENGTHSVICSRCDAWNVDEPIDCVYGNSYTYDGEDTETHSATCTVCGYNLKNETCSIVNDVCTKCKQKFEVTVTVYFHPSNYGWTTANLNIHAFDDDGNLTGAWPGKAMNDDDGDGWYTANFQVGRSRIGKDLAVIVNDAEKVGSTVTGHYQTKNISVYSTEVYISGYVYTALNQKTTGMGHHYFSKQEVLDVESEKVKTDNNWMVTGSFTAWLPKSTVGEYSFTAANNYTVILNLNLGDTFKLKKNVDNWNTEYKYNASAVDTSAKTYIEEASTDNNFYVSKDCRIKIVLTNPTTPTVKIYLISAGVKDTTHTKSVKEADHHVQTDATCTTPGNIEYWECADHCGARLDENGKVIYNVIIPINSEAHKYQYVPAQAATCNDTGIKEHWVCEHCGKWFEGTADNHNTQPFEPNAENFIEQKDPTIHPKESVGKVVEEKSATCTAAGTRAHYECSDCGKWLEVAGDTYNPEPKDPSEFVIDAKGHTYKLADVDPWTWTYDSVVKAVLKLQCKDCNDVQEIELTMTEGLDSPITRNTVTAATCTAAERITYTAKISRTELEAKIANVIEGVTSHLDDSIVGDDVTDTCPERDGAPATGHTYEYTSLEWSDTVGYAKATLKLTCKNDGCEGDGHIITVELLAENQTTGESVNCGDKTTVTMVLDPKSTSNLELINAKVGENHFEESELNDHTLSQQLSETTLGHKWKLAKNPYKWTEDETKATATVEVTLECSVCGKSVTATFTNTGRSTEEATCLKAEQITFTLTKAAGEVQAAVSVGQHGEVEVYKEDIFAEAAINNATYTIDGAAELGHDFDGSTVYVDNKDGTTHSKQCSRCDVVSQTKTSHDISYDVDVAGQTHTEKCDTCHYKAESAVACTPQIVLTTANGSETEKCSVCEQDYADKITVHFHINQDWGVDWGTKLYWYACYGSNSTVTKLTAAYPGNDTKETVSTSGSRWVDVEFTVSRQHLGKDLIIIFSDSNFQTHNVEIEDNEIWISKDGFWATSESDITSHESSTTLPTTSDYILVGTIGDEDFWYQQSTSAYNAFLKSNSYTLTLNFVAGNEFKVKLNVSSTTTYYGYDKIKSITYADTTKSVDLNDLITEAAGDGDENIHINKDCTLEITYDHSVGILIHVVKATGLSSITTKFYFKGTHDVTGSTWNANVKMSKGKSGDDGNVSYTVKYKLSANGQFKIGDLNWNQGTGSKGTVSKLSWVGGSASASSYFTFGSKYDQNVTVKKACTVVVTYYPDGGDWTDNEPNGGGYKTGWVDIVVVA